MTVPVGAMNLHETMFCILFLQGNINCPCFQKPTTVCTYNNTTTTNNCVPAV